jgi:hypothetical protein
MCGTTRAGVHNTPRQETDVAAATAAGELYKLAMMATQRQRLDEF